MLVSLLLTAFALSDAATWSRGSLTVTYGSASSSYIFSAGPLNFSSTPNSLAGASSWAEGSGTSVLGAYDSLTATYADAGSLAIFYYAAVDAFEFARAPTSLALPSSWPSFEILSQPANSSRCLGWSEHYFYPGVQAGGASLADCSSGGPLFVFDAAGDSQALPFLPRATLALSPLSHFTSNAVGDVCPKTGGGPPTPSSDCAIRVDAGAYGCGAKGVNHCLLFNTSALLLARPGLSRAIRATGSILRQTHYTTRSRGDGVTALASWWDNQSGYSWWSVGNDMEVWGVPEDIYLKLKKGYDAAGVAIRTWEPDNNFVVDYAARKNWIGRDLGVFNDTLYPSGGEGFVANMSVGGNVSFVYYSNGFADDNVYAKDWSLVGPNEPHPNVSQAFYTHVFSNATQLYGMTMLFTDFLCFRGPSMAAFQDVDPREEGEHLWLGGMVAAVAEQGCEVQFCMALAHQILASLEWPAVTNARANGDGGLDTPAFVLTSVLASMVGLGWSKDNLRTADKCYNDALYPNGTVMWACDAMNAGEAVNGAFKMQAQQTALAALSLGPVGIADQLSARPDDPSATITSNLTLVNATCAATGDLLQPSAPATPIERMLVEGAGFGNCYGANHRPYTFGCGTNVFATYTAVPSSDTVAIYYQALAFVFGRGQLATTLDLFDGDLAVMVDASALPAPLLDTVPRGAFTGAGTTFAADGASGEGHVVWTPREFLGGGGCANVATLAVSTGNVTLSLNEGGADGAAHAFFAPAFKTAAGTFALLGESRKVVPVSTFRFAQIAAAPDGIHVSVRGGVDEGLQLLFATLAEGGGVACQEVDLRVGSTGTASVSFP